VTLGAPNDAHRAKCEQHRDAVEQALSTHSGSKVVVELVVDGGGSGGGAGGGNAGDGDTSPAPAAPQRAPAPVSTPSTSAPSVSPTMSTTGALAHDSDPVVDASADPARLSVVPVVDADPPIADPPIADTVVVDASGPPDVRPAINGRAIAEQARTEGPGPDPDAGFQQAADNLPPDDEVDLDDLVDAPPETVKTPIDRLAEAFPGSEMVDDQY
jgi:DNA polymerase-3 subunit gamma/tau